MKLLISATLLFIFSTIFGYSRPLPEPGDTLSQKQELPDSLKFNPADTVPKIKEKFSIKYKFYPKDSIFYYAESMDSILIDDELSVLKKRKERILVICDSVSNGVFHLRQKMVGYHSFESPDGKEWVEDKKHSWVGRTAYFGIDSLGNRKYASLDDSSRADICPGGVFQPNIFMPYFEPIKADKDSWFRETTDKYPECGAPMPEVRKTFLYQMDGRIDTMGKILTKLNFAVTGKGTYDLRAKELQVLNNGVLHTAGDIYISPEIWLPVKIYVQTDVTLKIIQNGKKEVKGKQLSSTVYLLDEINRLSTNLKLTEPKQKAKNKKLKKPKTLR